MSLPPNRMPAPAGAAGGREVELKLRVDPRDLPRLPSLGILLDRADGPPRRTRLRTSYWDTPDRRLSALGVALRVRSADGGFVQALKTMSGDPGGDSAAVAVRREWEWPITADTPDTRLLEADDVAAFVPAEARQELTPVFITDFERTTILVRPDPRTAIEVAIDSGEVVAGDRRERISEIELELKAGRVARLFDLALELQRVVPLRIAMENKAEIGYRLLTGRAPEPVRPEPTALSPVTTVAEAFRHALRQALRQLLANEPCVLAAADAEGLHQMRGAVRRLRTALKLFRSLVASPESEELSHELRWLAGRLAAVGDWDGLIDGVLEPLAADPDGTDAPMGPLLGEARIARRSAADAALEAVRSPRFTALVLELAAWLEEGRWHAEADETVRAVLPRPALEVSRPWLEARHAKARKAGKPFDSLDDDGREKLRRRLRRLRYATEFFRGLYPPAAARPYLAALVALETTLDALHEIAVARALLGRLAERGGAATHKGADAVRRLLAERAEARREELPILWRGFKAAPEFWG